MHEQRLVSPLAAGAHVVGAAAVGVAGAGIAATKWLRDRRARQREEAQRRAEQERAAAIQVARREATEARQIAQREAKRLRQLGGACSTAAAEIESRRTALRKSRQQQPGWAKLRELERQIRLCGRAIDDLDRCIHEIEAALLTIKVENSTLKRMGEPVVPAPDLSLHSAKHVLRTAQDAVRGADAELRDLRDAQLRRSLTHDYLADAGPG